MSVYLKTITGILYLICLSFCIDCITLTNGTKLQCIIINQSQNSVTYLENWQTKSVDKYEIASLEYNINTDKFYQAALAVEDEQKKINYIKLSIKNFPNEDYNKLFLAALYLRLMELEKAREIIDEHKTSGYQLLKALYFYKQLDYGQAGAVLLQINPEDLVHEQFFLYSVLLSFRQILSGDSKAAYLTIKKIKIISYELFIRVFLQIRPEPGAEQYELLLFRLQNKPADFIRMNSVLIRRFFMPVEDRALSAVLQELNRGVRIGLINYNHRAGLSVMSQALMNEGYTVVPLRQEDYIPSLINETISSTRGYSAIRALTGVTRAPFSIDKISSQVWNCSSALRSVFNIDYIIVMYSGGHFFSVWRWKQARLACFFLPEERQILFSMKEVKKQVVKKTRTFSAFERIFNRSLTRVFSFYEYVAACRL
ncbi:MAG TPA: hypothetical protein DC049_10050 [Spirochaetia bacterium]|nr:hypothetical protein [Spirochaetia bacterium]